MTVRITVVDSNGAVIPNAKVSVTYVSDGLGWPPGGPAVYTDANGVAAFNNATWPAAGTYTATNGLATGSTTVNINPFGDSTGNIRLNWAPANVITKDITGTLKSISTWVLYFILILGVIVIAYLLVKRFATRENASKAKDAISGLISKIGLAAIAA